MEEAHKNTKNRPLGAYYSLENWLYNQKDKDTKTKSSMLWGGLWILKEMGIITWDEMRTMYGEFMSKEMGLR
nr:hypothetical protein [Lachnoclostridium phocaeense]